MTCLINSFEKAKDFVVLANDCQGDVNVSQGHFIVDGKSIVGVLSLNLTKPVEVQCVNKKDENILGCYAEVEA